MSFYIDSTMTDVEYYKLTLLFECKLLTKHDLESLERWVTHYTEEGFALPNDVIETLETYPDRPGHRYTP